MAVAEGSQAAEEASRRKSQADKQQSSELAGAGAGMPMGFPPQDCHVFKSVPFLLFRPSSWAQIMSFGSPSRNFIW